MGVGVTVTSVRWVRVRVRILMRQRVGDVGGPLFVGGSGGVDEVVGGMLGGQERSLVILLMLRLLLQSSRGERNEEGEEDQVSDSQ
jgi:hypothetical protein